MTLASLVKISPVVSLGVVVAILGASILFSVARSDAKVRDLLVHVGGWVLLLVGLALLVLPGPGSPCVLAGLAILGRRHAWARLYARKIRQRGTKWMERLRSRRGPIGKAPTPVPPQQ